MTGRDDLLAAIDRARDALSAGRTRLARRELENARALAVLPTFVESTTVCDECEIGGGQHAEGCSRAGGQT